MTDKNESHTDNEDEGDYPTCTYSCSHSGCTKSCCKAASPAHLAYGTHYCSEHK